MKIEQAIHCLKNDCDEEVCEECDFYHNCTHEIRADVARLAVAALEKQIAKKPVQGEPYTWIDSVKVRGRYKEVKKTSYGHACPNCGENVAKLRDEYCSKCGQAIDWN